VNNNTPDLPVAVTRQALYAVLDERADGTLRIVARFVEPLHAKAAAELLLAAGAIAHVELLTAVEDAPPA
jgi:hypothetical protein